MALANCAMMGIGPEECGRMDFWTYQALLWNWDQAHDPNAKKEPVVTDIERLRRFHHARHAPLDS